LSKYEEAYGKCLNGRKFREGKLDLPRIPCGLNPSATPQKTRWLLRELKHFIWIGKWLCYILSLNEFMHACMNGFFKIVYAGETCRFLDPAIRGDYPKEMREILGDDLPPVPEILKRLKPSIDFIGVNHYTSYFVKDCLHSACEEGGLGSTRTEGSALTWAHVDGRTIGKPVCIYETLC